MKRWDCKAKTEKESPEIDAFIEDIIKVYDTHGFSIGHEDGYGAFIIEPDNSHNRYWVRHAHISKDFVDD